MTENKDLEKDLFSKYRDSLKPFTDSYDALKGMGKYENFKYLLFSEVSETVLLICDIIKPSDFLGIYFSDYYENKKLKRVFFVKDKQQLSVLIELFKDRFL